MSEKMRQYKFRAWDGTRMLYDYRDACLWNGILVAEGDTILLEYTGLQDTHGTHIFEGDILQVDWQDSRYPVHLIGPVTWNTEEARWSLGEGGSAKHDAEYFMLVIGNIYEHPDLLEKRR